MTMLLDYLPTGYAQESGVVALVPPAYNFSGASTEARAETSVQVGD